MVFFSAKIHDLPIFANMETIPKAECQQIGFFRKRHGVQGEMVLEFEPHFEYSVEDAQRLFAEIDGLLVPFFLMENGFRFKTDNTAIVALDGVDTEKYAKRLVSKPVFLFTNEIIDDEEEDIAAQFSGYMLHDKELGEIGQIDRVDDYAGNIVFTVDHHGNELLVPYSEELLIYTDEEKKTIYMSLPKGLTD